MKSEWLKHILEKPIVLSNTHILDDLLQYEPSSKDDIPDAIAYGILALKTQRAAGRSRNKKEN